jgi:2-hydroxychromene-2-carboxylate isomerase
MHAVLMQLLAEEGDRVRLVRLTAPMPSHPHSRHASRAFVCAQDQDRGEEMAEALFVAWDLTSDGCDQLATSIGLSQPAFRACVVAPETDQRLDADVEWVKVASPSGLPVIWVQDRMLFGVQPIEALRNAVREAERQVQQRTPVAED